MQGEAPDRRKLWLLALVFAAGAIVVAVLTVISPDPSFMAATDTPHLAMSDDDLGPMPEPTLAEVEARVGTLEIDLAAAAAASLLLQNRIGELQASHTAEIAEIKAAIEASGEKATDGPRRARKPVPDPPASSYLNLR